MDDKELQQNTTEQDIEPTVGNTDEIPVADDDTQTGAKPLRKRRIDYDEALKNFDNKEIAAPKKKKYSWLGTIFLFVIIGVGIWLMFGMASKMEDGIKSFDQVIADSDWKFALITLGVLLVIIITDSLKYSIVMKTIDGKYRVKTSIKTSLLGKYYDSITPFSTGGQPMQIYYLHKKGFSGGKASAVVFIKFFANMFAWLIVSSLCMIINSSVLGRYDLGGTGADLLKIAGWIGWASNAILPIFIIMFVLIPKFSYKLASGIIWLGWKIRIVKDKDKTLQKAFGVVRDFRAAFAIMSKHPIRFIGLFLCCFIEVTALFAFPYFVLRMFNGLKSTDGIGVLFDVMTLNVYANFSVAIIPTPGNSGFLENMMTIAFSGISDSVLFWFVFVWRFLTYYMYILIGIGISLFEIIRNFVRSKREKKKQESNSV